MSQPTTEGVAVPDSKVESKAAESTTTATPQPRGEQPPRPSHKTSATSDKTSDHKDANKDDGVRTEGAPKPKKADAAAPTHAPAKRGRRGSRDIERAEIKAALANGSGRPRAASLDEDIATATVATGVPTALTNVLTHRSIIGKGTGEARIHLLARGEAAGDIMEQLNAKEDLIVAGFKRLRAALSGQGRNVVRDAKGQQIGVLEDENSDFVYKTEMVDATDGSKKKVPLKRVIGRAPKADPKLKTAHEVGAKAYRAVVFKANGTKLGYVDLATGHIMAEKDASEKQPGASAEKQVGQVNKESILRTEPKPGIGHNINIGTTSGQENAVLRYEEIGAVSDDELLPNPEVPSGWCKLAGYVIVSGVAYALWTDGWLAEGLFEQFTWDNLGAFFFGKDSSDPERDPPTKSFLEFIHADTDLGRSIAEKAQVALIVGDTAANLLVVTPTRDWAGLREAITSHSGLDDDQWAQLQKDKAAASPARKIAGFMLFRVLPPALMFGHFFVGGLADWLGAQAADLEKFTFGALDNSHQTRKIVGWSAIPGTLMYYWMLYPSFFKANRRLEAWFYRTIAPVLRESSWNIGFQLFYSHLIVQFVRDPSFNFITDEAMLKGLTTGQYDRGQVAAQIVTTLATSYAVFMTRWFQSQDKLQVPAPKQVKFDEFKQDYHLKANPEPYATDTFVGRAGNYLSGFAYGATAKEKVANFVSESLSTLCPTWILQNILQWSFVAADNKRNNTNRAASDASDFEIIASSAISMFLVGQALLWSNTRRLPRENQIVAFNALQHMEEFVEKLRKNKVPFEYETIAKWHQAAVDYLKALKEASKSISNEKNKKKGCLSRLRCWRSADEMPQADTAKEIEKWERLVTKLNDILEGYAEFVKMAQEFDRRVDLNASNNPSKDARLAVDLYIQYFQRNSLRADLFVTFLASSTNFSTQLTRAINYVHFVVKLVYRLTKQTSDTVYRNAFLFATLGSIPFYKNNWGVFQGGIEDSYKTLAGCAAALLGTVFFFWKYNPNKPFQYGERAFCGEAETNLLKRLIEATPEDLHAMDTAFEEEIDRRVAGLKRLAVEQHAETLVAGNTRLATQALAAKGGSAFRGLGGTGYASLDEVDDQKHVAIDVAKPATAANEDAGSYDYADAELDLADMDHHSNLGIRYRGKDADTAPQPVSRRTVS